jgi:hypothetical protein
LIKETVSIQFEGSDQPHKTNNMSRVTLYHYEVPEIKITIEAYFKEEWLMVEGYDIGKRVEELLGDSDYEYVTGVDQEELKKLYPLMNVPMGDKEGLLMAIAGRFNTNSCYSEYQAFLNNNGIKAEAFSWT